MTAILAGCSLFVGALVIAVAFGRFLAHCEALGEPPPTRRVQPDSLYIRLLRSTIEGPKDQP
jgi:hypothetical protein